MLGPEEFASGLGIGLKSFFGGTVGEPEREREREGGRGGRERGERGSYCLVLVLNFAESQKFVCAARPL